MSTTFILGGARSGKSSYAQELAGRLGRRVLYVATAEALDDEMRSRIEAHKRSRPSTWATIEAPRDVAEAIRSKTGDAEVVVIDCLTLLVANLMGGEDEIGQWRDRVAAEVERLIALVDMIPSHFIIVSNEVGLGVVPANPLARAYRDILGEANQMIAGRADEVCFMVAGIPVPIKKKDEPG
jgi:adenosylcobinamide kinase/adenosylcobinamide-phosphate guanylyltransferase